MEERLEEITEAFYQSGVIISSKYGMETSMKLMWLKGCALPRCISAWGLSLNGACPLSRTYRTNFSR